MSSYRLVYLNSNGNPSGEITFGEYDFLSGNRLVLGYKNSPQYESAPEQYLYAFSSSGLASTAGQLELYHDEQLVDVVCWGKLQCANSFDKFSTASDNQTICLQSYCDADYRAELNLVAIVDNRPPAPPIISCTGLEISEIYSYYVEDSSEQFIELHNPTTADILLDNCRLNYKKQSFTLTGTLAAGQYLSFQDDDLVLTKNPAKPIIVTVTDTDGALIITANQAKKQKRGSSLAFIGGQ